MNIEGLRAFEAAHREHMERSTYAELFRLISEEASNHNVRCRIDALHLLTLNFEFMVAEPLGLQRSGTMSSILHGDVRNAIVGDLGNIFKDLPPTVWEGSAQERPGFDPSSEETDGRQLEYVSSGRMLEHVGENYRSLRISKWRLWG